MYNIMISKITLTIISYKKIVKKECISQEMWLQKIV